MFMWERLYTIMCGLNLENAINLKLSAIPNKIQLRFFGNLTYCYYTLHCGMIVPVKV